MTNSEHDERIAWGGDYGIVLLVRESSVRLGYIGDEPAGARIAPFDQLRNPIEVHTAGGRLPHAGRHVGYGQTERLVYRGHEVTTAGSAQLLTLIQDDRSTGLTVTTTWARLAAVRAVTVASAVGNSGASPVRVEFVSSLVFAGFLDSERENPFETIEVGIPDNGFCAEFRWRFGSLEEHGLVLNSDLPGSTPHRNRIPITSLGTMPTIKHLPHGALVDRSRDRCWLWQIEHNGSWHWEVGDDLGGPYLSASGPTDAEHQWRRTLQPGDEFTSLPVTITSSEHDLQEAFARMTEYRRASHRKTDDLVELPIVFNDYMNCLVADPDEDKLIPLIDSIAGTGCEVFCIDAGWYSDSGGWWTTVGAWEESSTRFPHGLRTITDRIRSHGMTPGLWIEPEVVGVDSPVVDELPEDAFLSRGGEKVDALGRYLLDFRNPLVRARMDGVIDRLVRDYGLGYFKFDYNVQAGVGSDRAAEAPGTALLEHNQAYLAWVDGIFERHPGLVIEGCASGGARLDPATLSRHSIVSTSDQNHPLWYVPIAAGAATAMPPEQAGVWVLPEQDSPSGEFEVSIVNGLLARPQVSGGAGSLRGERREALLGALEVYKTYRRDIPSARPSWPLGLPTWTATWCAFALNTDSRTLVQVWRRGGDDEVTLDVPALRGTDVAVRTLFPSRVDAGHEWDPISGRLRVVLPTAPAARLLELAPMRKVETP